MKIITPILLALLLVLSSCASLENALSTAIKNSGTSIADQIAEDITSGTDAVPSDAAAEKAADKALVIEADAEPELKTPTKEEIIAAVENLDLDGLNALLENVDDVKTIIGKDVPILVLAEEAAGVNGIENPVTALLVEKGAYILQRDDKGRDIEKVIQEFEVAATPRHEYILGIIGDKKKRYWDALKNDSLDGIKELLEYLPVDANLLLDAAHQKAEAIAGFALAEGVSVDSRNSKGATVLHLACDSYTHKRYDERTSLIRTVLEAGADTAAVDSKNKTPLLYVIEASQNVSGSMTDIVKLLLEHGADPNDADSRGKTVLTTSVERQKYDTALVLLEYGADPVIPEHAVLNMKPDTVKSFVEAGVDAEAFTRAIIIQDHAAQSELVHYLIDQGAPAAAFDLVQVRDNIPLLEYLVEQGADINSSKILSSYAMKYAGPEVLEFLAAHGADMNKRFYNDQTALHYAVKSKNLDAVRFFIEHGTEINALDTKGKTALDYCKTKDEELYRYMIDSGAKTAEEL